MAVISGSAAVCVWQLNHSLLHRSPESLHGQDVSVRLRIVAVNDERPLRQTFVAETEKTETDLLARRWRIAWYGVPQDGKGNAITLRVGDSWRMTVRVRKQRGLGNPGSFDVAAWHLRDNIDAVAYVRSNPAPEQISEPRRAAVSVWRSELADKVRKVSPHTQAANIVVALTLGFRQGIDEAFSTLLINTGTAHLLAISGLHIGLVSAAGFFLMRWVWWLCPALALRCSRNSFAGIFGVVFAFGYAVLAGLSPSTLRAVGMCAVGFLLLARKRSVAAALPFAIVLSLLVLSDVTRVLSPGVWLSFAAVALILLNHRGRQTAAPKWLQLLRTHTVLAVCLLPITGWFFAQGSIVSPLANWLAVPWVSLVVVPLSLAIVAAVIPAPAMAAWLMDWVHLALEILHEWLQLCAAIPGASITVSVPSVLVACAAVLGGLFLGAPPGASLRRYAVPLCVPLLIWSTGLRAVNGLEVHVLDVAQGHATLLLTEKHAVLVDTGGRVGGDRSHAEATVLPALKKLGKRELTHIIVSHSDSDHAAGLNWLAQQFPHAEFWLGGDTEAPPNTKANACQAGVHWQTDGVEFSFLHPYLGSSTAHVFGEDNDRSCVLLVQLGSATVVFPGDLERRGEALLLSRMASTDADAAPLLPATVLIAPHHGSQTSSTAAFIEALQPQHVVFTAGYQNRLGFPHAEVRARYDRMGSETYTTGEDGAISFYLSELGLKQAPTRFWQTRSRLWQSTPNNVLN